MIDRVLLLSMAGCALFGTLLLFELYPRESRQPAVVPPLGHAEQHLAPSAVQHPRIDELMATILGRPLFSVTRRPPERANTAAAAAAELPDVRLTGIVIEPSRRLAIFAVPDGKPLVRSEGETIKDWRLDSIALHKVSLSGPAGARTLEPKVDPKLVRPHPPALPPRPGASGTPAVIVANRPPVPALPQPGPTLMPTVRAPISAPALLGTPNPPRPPQ